MTQDNYEGTDPCREIELEWRHAKVNYIIHWIENLSKEDKIKVYNHLRLKGNIAEDAEN